MVYRKWCQRKCLSWWVRSWHRFEVGLVTRLTQNTSSADSSRWWISSLVRHRVGLMGEQEGGTGWGIMGRKQRKQSSSSDSWLADEKATRRSVRHVVVTAVTETVQLRCCPVPPGPWFGRTLGPGWGSGLWSRSTAAPGRHSPRIGPTEARTTRWDRRSPWIRPSVSAGGGSG